VEFLYSLNRLDVATSRARCVSILAGSPLLFEAECHTPRQIRLANAFCRYLEMATGLNAVERNGLLESRCHRASQESREINTEGQPQHVFHAGFLLAGAGRAVWRPASESL
jgi:hypothetical protein